MATNMTSKVLVDGRNLYQLQKLQAKGWSDYSVGLTAIDPAEQIMVKIFEIFKE